MGSHPERGRQERLGALARHDRGVVMCGISPSAPGTSPSELLLAERTAAPGCRVVVASSSSSGGAGPPAMRLDIHRVFGSTSSSSALVSSVSGIASTAPRGPITNVQKISERNVRVSERLTASATYLGWMIDWITKLTTE